MNIRPLSLEGIEDIREVDLARSGIYFLCDRCTILYIGQSKYVTARIGAHSSRFTFNVVYFLPWPADDLDRIEEALIDALAPPLNQRIKPGLFNDSSDEIARIIARYREHAVKRRNEAAA
jgi:hypothetical protein